MYSRILRNDIRRSKAITLTTTLFVAAAAMLVALAAVLVVNLAGAIDTLMAQSKTPHFTQMHAGEYLPGVYDETRDDLKAREKDLTAWLDGMKF
jgi:hypothetical protein